VSALLGACRPTAKGGLTSALCAGQRNWPTNRTCASERRRKGRKEMGRHYHPAGNTATHDFAPIRDSRLPPPNTVLTRLYKGRTIEVTVLEDGFDFEGATFRTLRGGQASDGSQLQWVCLLQDLSKRGRS